MILERTLGRWFPVPHILAPHAHGVDITDASVKWLSFVDTAHGKRIATYGNQPIPEGVVETGAIRDVQTLANVLMEIKKKAHISRAHAALPEEAAYVFNMFVHPGSRREEIVHMIEFEMESRVPIPPAQTVYDFDTVATNPDKGEEIAVTVFPKELADGYIAAFARAGITLASLEIEARSIARAVTAKTDTVTLLVDCGKARTGVAILKKGIPIFTSTFELGGDQMSEAVMKALHLSPEDAVTFKNERGLVPTDPKLNAGTEAIHGVAVSLAKEITRHYRFWDTRRTESNDASAPVEKIYLVGGSANVRGLPDFIASETHAPAERPDVWRNVFSLDEYIPPIEYRASLQYATAIGLALRSH